MAKSKKVKMWFQQGGKFYQALTLLPNSNAYETKKLAMLARHQELENEIQRLDEITDRINNTINALENESDRLYEKI